MTTKEIRPPRKLARFFFLMYVFKFAESTLQSQLYYSASAVRHFAL